MRSNIAWLIGYEMGRRSSAAPVWIVKGKAAVLPFCGTFGASWGPMKLFNLLSVLVLCGSTLSGRCELQWLTDTKTALEKARQENKAVLLDFTGSDWCGWCMKLKSEVFDQPEFAQFAQANLVLVEVDFPKRK